MIFSNVILKYSCLPFHKVIGSKTLIDSAVGTGWAQGHMPTQYFRQQVLMPIQCFFYTQDVAIRMPT